MRPGSRLRGLRCLWNINGAAHTALLPRPGDELGRAPGLGVAIAAPAGMAVVGNIVVDEDDGLAVGRLPGCDVGRAPSSEVVEAAGSIEARESGSSPRPPVEQRSSTPMPLPLLLLLLQRRRRIRRRMQIRMTTTTTTSIAAASPPRR